MVRSPLTLALALLATLLTAFPASAARDTSRACPDGDVPPAGYTDIGPNPHQPSIDCMAWWDIDIYGGSGSYEPGKHITRAEHAGLLANLLDVSGLQDRGSTADQGFEDIHAHRYEDQINRLVSLDVIAGKSATRFDPDGTITRAQMASLIVQLHQNVYGRTLQPGDGFADVPESNPHEPNVRRLVEAGITDGRTADTYDPAGKVTRAQIASFTMRHTALLVELDEATLPGDFDPIRLSGSGDDVLDVSIPGDELAIAEVTHDGPGYFGITITDADNEYAGLLANEIGTYQGIAPIHLGSSNPMRGLDVDADGTWTITIKPIAEARDLTDAGLDGTTDDVLDAYRLAGQVVDITHTGDGYFGITAYTDDGDYNGLVANEAGPYEGTQRIPAGTRWLEVDTDGLWTIELSR